MKDVLPNKLSELLKLALTDLEVIERTPGYEVDIDLPPKKWTRKS